MDNLENSFEMRITLNKGGYDQRDMDALISGTFGTKYKARGAFDNYITACGPDLISIECIITVSLLSVAAFGAKAFIDQFARRLADDIYGWSKNELRSVTQNKHQFNGSQFIIEFNDVKFIINTNEKEELLKTSENFLPILERLISKYIEAGKENKLRVDLNYYDHFDRFIT